MSSLGQTGNDDRRWPCPVCLESGHHGRSDRGPLRAASRHVPRGMQRPVRSLRRRGKVARTLQEDRDLLQF